MGDAGVDHVYELTEWHENIDNTELSDYAAKYKSAHQDDWRYMRVRFMFGMLAQALNEVGDDPSKVAGALSGMTYETPLGQAVMQAENHQILLPQFVTVLSRDVPRDLEGTGIGRKTVESFPAEAGKLPTTCKMQQPS